MRDIKPCPFCGSAPEIDDQTKLGYKAVVWCVADSCNINPSTSWHKTLDSAVVAWNTRVRP